MIKNETIEIEPYRLKCVNNFNTKKEVKDDNKISEIVKNYT